MFKTEDPIVFFKSSENMAEVDDNSIQLIITSPPYGKIKNYGTEEQIGFFDSFGDYFNRLKKVWSECYRILEPQCRIVINVGDQYLRTSEYGRYRILSISSRIISDCMEIGYDFLGDIIWQKVSTTNTTGGCSLMGSIYYPRNGLLTFDYEHTLIFKKHDGKARKVALQTKELSKISLSEWKKWYVGHWKFPGVVQKEHIAMFPEELPYRLIRMFSFVGDTVLDPFVGSGTTLKVAKSLFRKSIGYEINDSYKKIIENKIGNAKVGYFKDYQFLIYKIFLKSKKDNFKIAFNKQKQKGILVLENDKDLELIIDYLLLNKEKFDRELILKELKSKFKENSVVNYLKEEKNWEKYTNYIVVINSEFSNINDIVNLLREFLKTTNYTKYQRKIQFILYNQIVSNEFNLSDLFEEKKDLLSNL